MAIDRSEQFWPADEVHDLGQVVDVTPELEQLGEIVCRNLDRYTNLMLEKLDRLLASSPFHELERKAAKGLEGAFD